MKAQNEGKLNEIDIMPGDTLTVGKKLIFIDENEGGGVDEREDDHEDERVDTCENDETEDEGKTMFFSVMP